MKIILIYLIISTREYQTYNRRVYSQTLFYCIIFFRFTMIPLAYSKVGRGNLELMYFLSHFSSQRQTLPSYERQRNENIKYCYSPIVNQTQPSRLLYNHKLVLLRHARLYRWTGHQHFPHLWKKSLHLHSLHVVLKLCSISTVSFVYCNIYIQISLNIYQPIAQTSCL